MPESTRRSADSFLIAVAALVAALVAASQLVRELADIHGTGFGLTSSPEAIETETLAALQTAKTTLESKAPDELESYRQFVVGVAQSVADVAGGGETAEGSTIEMINSALR